MTNRRCLLALLAATMAVLLCRCGAPQPPKCSLWRMPTGWRQAAPALERARDAWSTLAGNPDADAGMAAGKRYNESLGHLFAMLRCDRHSWQYAATEIGTTFPSQTVLGIRLEDIKAIFPASQVNTRKVGERKTREGIGLPVVAWIPREKLDPKTYPFAPPDGLALPLTALLRFEAGKTPEWCFEWTREQGTIRVGQRELPLAADWSAANAFFWHMSDLDDLDLRAVFLPDRFYGKAGLYCNSPYNPDKIPVVFVHGLKSSPAAFRRMLNHLITQDWFRENYQSWYFSYPTGTPWMYNSMLFREEIRKATAHARSKGSLENWDKMVIVAHSMGGLISRSSVAVPGNEMYDAWFDVPFDRLKGSEKSRELIRQAALYQPLDEPDRVIFIATPHRGAPMADQYFSNLITNLIRLPKWLVIDFVDLTLSNVARQMSFDEARKGLPTSIATLSPRNSSVRALNRMPFRAGVRRHSIIGDRGKGDSPNSSDGVVPYWSSHLEPVESEAIVPYHHGVPDHPACATEVARILKLHLQKP